MAAAKKAAGAKAAAETAWANEYVQRIIEDPELRDNVRSAVDSARSAYNRANGKAPAKLLDDKKLHKDLQQAADDLRSASDALRGKRAKKKGGLGRLLLLTVVGGVAALALSEGLRNKVLDALFGAEEEFDYTSTTQPATPAPDAAATATASSNGG